MHVPDSITIGPNRAAPSRLHQDQDRLPLRMEVPDSIRLGNGKRIIHRILLHRLSLLIFRQFFSCRFRQ